MPEAAQGQQPPTDPKADANAYHKLPRMIIKGMLGRYERWNPVHPTAGTFWGVGVGLGCGVGWGPGFGPEVIGYVGAGCGVGFSVGITLAGVGVGLPRNDLIRRSYSSLAASNAPIESARFYSLTIIRGLIWDVVNYASHASALRKESRPELQGFQENPQMVVGVDLPKLGKGISTGIQSTVKSFRAFKDQHWPPVNGT